MPVAQLLAQVGLACADGLHVLIQFVQLQPAALDSFCPALKRGAAMVQSPVLAAPTEAVPGSEQALQLLGQQCVTLGALGLALQASEPGGNLVDDVIHPQQVGARLF